MLLFDYRPTEVGDTLEIQTMAQLSAEEQRLALETTSPEVFFASVFRHDATLLPRNYVLTRCEVAQHGDGSGSIWKVKASAKRKAGGVE